MREFFQSWRRKAGCVTLAMSCVFMAGWVRGVRRVDVLHYRGKLGDIRMLSSRRGLMWISDKTTSRWEKEPPFYWEYECDKEGGAFEGMLDYVDKKFGGYFGFRYRWTQPTSTLMGSKILVIPYSSSVIPLTLLSAYLLLTKPRPATSIKTCVPSTVAGT